MPVNLDQALGIHAYGLNMRAERAKILASNIANVDTPGFKAKDIDFAATLQNIERQLDQAMTNGSMPSASIQQSVKYRVPMQPSQDGNTSELGVEQAKFNENAMDFETSVTFMNSKISGLRKAIVGR